MVFPRTPWVTTELSVRGERFRFRLLMITAILAPPMTESVLFWWNNCWSWVKLCISPCFSLISFICFRNQQLEQMTALVLEFTYSETRFVRTRLSTYTRYTNRQMKVLHPKQCSTFGASDTQWWNAFGLLTKCFSQKTIFREVFSEDRFLRKTFCKKSKSVPPLCGTYTRYSHSLCRSRTSPIGKHVHFFRMHRQECPEITYMAMAFRPHSFPVGGMYMNGTGRLTKVKKNRSLLFSIAS